MILNGCILFWSMFHQIDPSITKAVISIESNGNPKAVGQGRDFGLMQIRKQYVPYSKHQLLNSCTNIMVGTSILKQVKDSCKFCVDNTWIIGYNLGISGMKRIKYPKKFPYYVKIAKRLNNE